VVSLLGPNGAGKTSTSRGEAGKVAGELHVDAAQVATPVTAVKATAYAASFARAFGPALTAAPALRYGST